MRKGYLIWVSYVVILAHCYVIVMFSFAFNPMLMGEWYISLVLGLAACFWVTRCSAKAWVRSRGPGRLDQVPISEPRNV